MAARIIDEWTPGLAEIEKTLSRPEQRRILKGMQLWVQFEVRAMIRRQRGFATGRKYKKLKIKWRYHGRKTLVANKSNIRRARMDRDAVRLGRKQHRFTTWRYEGYRGGGSFTGISKTDKSEAIHALIDTRRFERSWTKLTRRHDLIDVGPNTPRDSTIANIHGGQDARSKIPQRGEFWWGPLATHRLMKIYEKEIDKALKKRRAVVK